METILKAILDLGPGGLVAALMFYMWLQERMERRELANKVMTLIAEGVEAEKDMTLALQVLTAKIKVTP